MLVTRDYLKRLLPGHRSSISNTTQSTDLHVPKTKLVHLERTHFNYTQKRSIYSLNKISLLGYVGADPEVHHFNEGSVTSFSLAISDSYINRSNGERVDRTEWFRIAIYNEKLQEIASNLISKGSRIYVEGQLRNRKWTDAIGQEKTSVEVQLRHKGELILVQKPAASYHANQGNTQNINHTSPTSSLANQAPDEE